MDFLKSVAWAVALLLSSAWLESSAFAQGQISLQSSAALPEEREDIANAIKLENFSKRLSVAVKNMRLSGNHLKDGDKLKSGKVLLKETLLDIIETHRFATSHDTFGTTGPGWLHLSVGRQLRWAIGRTASCHFCSLQCVT